MDNYERNDISNNYKIIEKQLEQKRVKNISSNEELKKITSKKAFSKKLIALIVAGAVFTSGIYVGTKIEKSKLAPNNKTTTEDTNKVSTQTTVKELCESKGKDTEEMYTDFLHFREEFLRMYNLKIDLNQDSFIDFIKNHDYYMELVNLEHENKTKKGSPII